jgi:cation diffusion facilitator family transporter
MEKSGKRVLNVLIIILFVNFLVALVKLLIGYTTGSLSLQADGYHSFADGASNIVGIVGIAMSSRPSDRKHPYGHKKFEVLSCFIIGIMLAYLSIKVAISGVQSLLNPVSLSFSVYELAIVAATVVINIIVSATENMLGKKWNSQILVSDSIHTRSDIIITTGVMSGAVAIYFGLPRHVETVVMMSREKNQV